MAAESIAALTKIASVRAIGLCFDEVAVNTKMLQDIEEKRKIPALLKVMGGSLAIKMAVIPVALAVNAFIPGLILPLLTLGGLHLASEGVRHMRGKYDHEEEAGSPDGKKSAKEFERDRIKKVLTIDGLLSVEITVMTLGVIAGAPVLTAAAVLAGAGLIRTSWMYALIGGILSMPRLGKWLEKREGDGKVAKAARSFGKSLDKAMPYIIKGFSIAGTAALLMIGGGLVLHGFGVEHVINHAIGGAISNGMLAGLAERAVATVAGIGIGLAAGPVLDIAFGAIGKGFKAAKKLVTEGFKGKGKDKQPKPAPQAPTPAAAPALSSVPAVKADLNAAAKPPVANDNAPAPAAPAADAKKTLTPPAA